MRNIILASGPFIVWFLAITEIALLVVSIKTAKKTINYLSAAVCFGLAVDATIIAIGSLLGEGAILQGISQIRYILHGILVPLLIPIAFYVYGVNKKQSKLILWIVTGTVIAAGIAMGFMIKTEPAHIAGILRYADSAASPAFANIMERILSFGGVIPLIVIGIAHWVKHKSPFLALSGIAMFVFSALGPATGNMDLNFLITMIGEDFMVFFFGLELGRMKKESEKVSTYERRNTQ